MSDFKYLFFLPCAHSSSVLGILLDEAMKLRNSGVKTELYYCDNYLDVCKFNYLGIKSKCISCSMKHKHLLNKYFNYENCFSLKELAEEKKIPIPVINLAYSSVRDIKNLNYNNTNIGLGCFSTYVSLSRNLHPLMNSEFKIYFSKLLMEAAKMVEIGQNIIDQKRETTVCLFNGRFLDSRPLVEICSADDIRFRCYEAGITKEFKTKKLYFENALPHDIKEFTEKVNKYWDKNPNSDEKKLMAKEFYQRKLNNLFAGSTVYTKNQDLKLLPENWDNEKQNISIFCSSEDEFVSIGGEYDEHSLFPSQLEAIKKIARLLNKRDDIHLYLRIHPNLKGIKYKYHTDLLNLDKKYENITVIPANSPISSYTLLKNSQKIIVFNSTVGVEAVYAGKPVISLTAAIYYYLDLTYKPTSVEELKRMLLSPLKPKPVIDALKYAYYSLYIEESFFDTVNFTEIKELKVFKHEFSFAMYTNLWGSKFLYWSYFKLISKIRTSLIDKKLFRSLPLKEKE